MKYLDLKKEYKILNTVFTEEGGKLEVEIPYCTGWSKNIMWIPTGRGVRMNPETRHLTKNLISTLEDGCVLWERKKKTDIIIHVVRPDFRSDPINFIDTLADAIKKGIGCDDRYFTMKLTWEYKKDNGKIYIGIIQEGEKEE